MVLAALSFVAGVVGGALASVAGSGFGCFLTPFLGALFGVRLAVAAAALPHLAGSALRLGRTREAVDWRVLRSLGTASAVAAALGAFADPLLGSELLGMLFGSLLVLTGLAHAAGIGRAPRHVALAEGHEAAEAQGAAAHPRRLGRGAAWAAGILSSTFGGLVGHHGGFEGALPGFGTSPGAVAATGAALALVVDGARIPAYLVAHHGRLASAWPLVAAATAGVLAGALLGEHVARRVARRTLVRLCSSTILLIGFGVLVEARAHVLGVALDRSLPAGEPFAPLAIPTNLPRDLPSYDALDAEVDTTRSFRPVVSAPRWVVPATNLPRTIDLEPSNNCVGIAYHEGKLFMAWRSAPTHFASSKTRLFVVSSKDFGIHWTHETTIALGTDVREPYLVSFKGHLILSFFEAGADALRFEPRRLWRTERNADGTWTPIAPWGRPGEIVWETKERGGRLWKTSYAGAHYFGVGGIDVFFDVSDDGFSWLPAAPKRRVAYHGGVSEVGFDFDRRGDLWAVMRNEDGDDTGFGSSVAFAKAPDFTTWDVPKKSDPERYDSPRLFRHGKDLYLVARRDVAAPFDDGWRFLPRGLRKYALWVQYSLRPKRTTLYQVDTVRRKVVPLLDLPSAGDTAFASIVRLDPDTFLVANYTSPPANESNSWILGQTDGNGTRIYLVTIRFEPEPTGAPAVGAR